WKNLRYAILVITIVAAIVTPTPDATTMLVFMAPMLALYFLGIGVSYMVFRKSESVKSPSKTRNEAAESKRGGENDGESGAPKGAQMLGGLRISLAIVALACAMGCSAAGNKSNVGASGSVAAAGPVTAPQDKAPARQQTGGFDGQR